ncbi:MAG: FecR domain-containing protein [Methylocystaceae bacterium]|nr:FecR domain-containing protein [Methylocystaceae bacterium]
MAIALTQTEQSFDHIIDVTSDGSSPAFPDGFIPAQGGYEQVQNDLVVTGENGESLLVPDFFSAQPEGISFGSGVLPFETVQNLSSSSTDGQYAQVGGQQASDSIGIVETVEGTVTVVHPDGTSATLQEGDPVFQGDVVRTADNSSIGLTFNDESSFSLDEGGEIALDEMVYDPETGEGAFSSTLTSGVFSFVSGQIAKANPEAMEISTPVATIGIRGTQGVIKQDNGGGMEAALLEEPGGFTGELILTNAGGSITLNQPNQYSAIVSFNSAPGQPASIDLTQLTVSFGGRTFQVLNAARKNSTARRAQQKQEEAEAEAEAAEEAAAQAAAAQAEAEAAQAEAEALAEQAAQAEGEEAELLLQAAEAAAAEAAAAEAAAAAAAEAAAAAAAAAAEAAAEAAAAEAAAQLAAEAEAAFEAQIAQIQEQINQITRQQINNNLPNNTEVTPDDGNDDDGTTDVDQILRDIIGAINDIVDDIVDDIEEDIEDDLPTEGDIEEQISETLDAIDEWHVGSVDARSLGDQNDGIAGLAGADTIHGGAGNDLISGGAGADEIYGDEGNDVIHGDVPDGIDAFEEIVEHFGTLGDSGVGGNDEIHGGDGDDLIHGGFGNDLLYGENDNDTIKGDDGTDTIYGGAGDDTIDGGADDDTIYGGKGNDIVNGDDGEDKLHDGDGTDVISGGEGNDTFYADDDTGNDSFAGGAGQNTLDFLEYTTGNLNLSLTTAGVGSVTYTNNATDTFTQMQTINLCAGNDTVSVASEEALFGTTLNAGDGTDTLALGMTAINFSNFSKASGFEILDLSAANTALKIDNSFVSTMGISTISGADGSDSIDLGGDLGGFWTLLSTSNGYKHYSNGSEDLYIDEDMAVANGYYETYTATSDVDTLPGTASQDYMFLAQENDTIHAGTGSDIMSGGSGSDVLYGEDGDDIIYGEIAPNSGQTAKLYELYGSSIAADTGPAGINRLYGGAGNDILVGGSAVDSLHGGSGNDSLYGGAGDDALYGGDESTLMGTGDDYLDGGAGNDKLYDSDGADTLLGGADNDIFWVLDDTYVDTFDGGAGDDTLQFDSDTVDNTFAVLTFSGSDSGTIETRYAEGGELYGTDEFTGFETLSLTDYNDTVTIGSGLSVAANINTGGNGDTINIEGSYSGTLDAGNSNDTVNISGTISGSVLGGGGSDTINVTGSSFASVAGTIDGGAGDDVISLANTLYANSGTIIGGSDDGGKGDVLKFTESEGSLSLFDGSIKFSGIETIDLAGSNMTLTLDDSILDDISGLGSGNRAVFIDGDDDTVILNNKYVVSGTQGEAGYTTYEDKTDATMVVHISNDLTVSP